MKKALEFLLIGIIEAIVIGFIVRWTSYEIAILTLLVMIYAKVSVGSDK